MKLELCLNIIHIMLSKSHLFFFSKNIFLKNDWLIFAKVQIFQLIRTRGCTRKNNVNKVKISNGAYRFPGQLGVTPSMNRNFDNFKAFQVIMPQTAFPARKIVIKNKCQVFRDVISNVC